MTGELEYPGMRLQENSGPAEIFYSLVNPGNKELCVYKTSLSVNPSVNNETPGQ